MWSACNIKLYICPWTHRTEHLSGVILRWQIGMLAKSHIKCIGSFGSQLWRFHEHEPAVSFGPPHFSQMHTATVPFTWPSPETQSCHKPHILRLCVWHCLNPYYRECSWDLLSEEGCLSAIWSKKDVGWLCYKQKINTTSLKINLIFTFIFT